MKQKSNIFSWLLFLCCFVAAGMLSNIAEAAHRGTIMFVPIDNRPISDSYGVDTLEKAGYTVLVPPDELLGGPGHLKGDADNVWQWVETALKEHGHVDTAVFSGDTMIYGSLVGSRTHELPEAELLEKVDRFRSLRQRYPNLKLYVFSSIMRTPHYSAAFGGTEAPYMDKYAGDFFIYSSLADKQELQKLSKQEKQALAEARDRIPEADFISWQTRRNTNLHINQAMLDLMQQHVFDYFVIGMDDNAPFSQTHRESRYLSQYAEGMDKAHYQKMTGIDEIGMLLLARANTDLNYTKPFIYAEYNKGVGSDMVPSFSSQTIGRTMDDYIRCAGGFHTRSLKRADLAMLVNTTIDGRDSFSGDTANVAQPAPQAQELAARADALLQQAVPTGVVDIAFYNGADNGLMQLLQEKQLLFKLTVYGGWNTASNSLGFAIGQGIYMPYIGQADKNDLLMTRYLDEWAYEANVRQQLSGYIAQLQQAKPGANVMETELADIEAEGNRLLQRFAAQHLQAYPNHKLFSMTLPWKRLFENKVMIHE